VLQDRDVCLGKNIQRSNLGMCFSLNFPFPSSIPRMLIRFLFYSVTMLNSGDIIVILNSCPHNLDEKRNLEQVILSVLSDVK
jgi:hypothetical protein